MSMFLTRQRNLQIRDVSLFISALFFPLLQHDNAIWLSKFLRNISFNMLLFRAAAKASSCLLPPADPGHREWDPLTPVPCPWSEECYSARYQVTIKRQETSSTAQEIVLNIITKAVSLVPLPVTQCSKDSTTTVSNTLLQSSQDTLS